MYSVAIYHVIRNYGGPEEGGWWYNSGTPITEVLEALPQEYHLPRYFKGEDAAIEYCTEVAMSLDTHVNSGKRPLGSVLSSGVYWARVEEGHPRPFPETRPHYE